MRVRISVDKIEMPLECNFCLEFKDVAKEVNFEKGNQLKSEYISLFSLPYVDEVHGLYKKYGLMNPIPAYVFEPYNMNAELRFTERNDRNAKYQAHLRIPIAEDILKCLSETKLCELDLGEYEFTEANILADWAGNKDRYQDGDTGAYPFFADFGGFLLPDTLTTSDIRLAISPLHILKSAAKKCGFCFVSPVMQSIRERHMWSYLYKESEWWEYEGHGLLGEAGLSDFGGSDITVNVFPFDFPVIDFDNNGNIFNNPTGRNEYRNNTNVTQCVKACLRGELVNTDTAEHTASLYYYAGVSVPVAPFTNLVFLQDVVVPAGATVAFDVCVEVDLDQFDIVTFYRQATDPAVIFNVSATFEICSKQHYPGDIVPLAQLLPCDKSVVDLLKDFMLLFGGLGDYDGRTKTFFMSTPYDTEVDGEQVEGYYKPVSQSAKLEVVCNSFVSSNIVEANNRVLLKFASSTDDHISEQIENGNRSELEANEGVFAYEYERGTNKDSTTRKTLLCYQPTLNDFEPAISSSAQAVYTPQIIGENKGLRLFYIFAGWQRFQGQIASLKLNSLPQSLYPTAYQEIPPDMEILISSDFAQQQLTMEEMYLLYQEKYSKRTAKNPTDKFQTIISFKDYRALSFRERVRIMYTDRQGNMSEYIGLLRVKRHDSCGKVVEFEFLKENFC